VPPACSLNLSISALSSINFVLSNSIVYLSGKQSNDLSASKPPLILELTTTPRNSTNVGRPVLSTSDSSDSEKEKYE
jgi:hypothetical protein